MQFNDWTTLHAVAKQMGLAGATTIPAPEWYAKQVSQQRGTLEATLTDLDCILGGENRAAAIITCIRLACTLCLLGDNPDVIRPDVLEADRASYDATHDAKYPAKAVRRGKVGWDVGRDLEPVIERGEVSPHYRRPHVGLRWTGEGRSIPRVVPITGSIVRRGKVVQVPTGHLDA